MHKELQILSALQANKLTLLILMMGIMQVHMHLHMHLDGKSSSRRLEYSAEYSAHAPVILAHINELCVCSYSGATISLLLSSRLTSPLHLRSMHMHPPSHIHASPVVAAYDSL